MLLSPSGVAPSADVSDLSAVLACVQTGEGRFRPDQLKGMAGRLDTQLKRMAVSGPTVTPSLYPTYGSRWAYWYNARAAWSMKLAMLEGFPRKVRPAFRRRPFPLDGREMTLDRIDRILLADAFRTGDFRLAACLPGVTFAYARLPDRATTAADFSRGLGDPFDELLCDDRRTHLDVVGKKLLLAVMLWDTRDLITSAHRQRYGVTSATIVTALRACAGQDARKRLEDALGYKAAPNRSAKLAVPGKKIYFPGKLGQVEP